MLRFSKEISLTVICNCLIINHYKIWNLHDIRRFFQLDHCDSILRFFHGEANFKVKTNKEKPFIVKTNDFQVTALGTEFNVSAYTSDENIFTTLISGSVLVEFADLTKKILLKPNEQLGYNRKSRQDTLTYPDMKDVTAWQKGGLVFNRKTITEIITILERKYDCKFFYNQHSLKNDRYSFRFKDNPPLSEVMDVIVDVAGDLYFKIEHDKCYIMQK